MLAHPWTMTKDLHTGTKPKTQLDNYRFLMKLRCVTTLKRHRLYQSLSDHHKICGSCYANTPVNLKPIYAFIVPHNLVHRDSVHYQENCTACGKEVISQACERMSRLHRRISARRSSITKSRMESPCDRHIGRRMKEL